VTRDEYEKTVQSVKHYKGRGKSSHRAKWIMPKDEQKSDGRSYKPKRGHEEYQDDLYREGIPRNTRPIDDYMGTNDYDEYGESEYPAEARWEGEHQKQVDWDTPKRGKSRREHREQVAPRKETVYRERRRTSEGSAVEKGDPRVSEMLRSVV